MKGMRASALSSEFCTVQVLKGPKNLSALRNSEVSAFGSILKYYINSASIGTASKWPHKRGVRYRECPLMEVPLYNESANCHLHVVKKMAAFNIGTR